MPYCLSADEKTKYQDRLTRYTNQLALLETAIDEGMANANISSYEFESGEGKQKTSYRNMNEVFKTIKVLETQIDRINNILCHKSMSNMRMTRF